MREECYRRVVAAALLGCALSLAAASSSAAEHARKDTMQLTSPAFTEGAPIPAKYTCDERDLSPPLKWSGAPSEAKSLVLITDDPDAPAGTWVHWVIYDLPASVSELPEELSKGQYVQGGKQGLNDFKRLGYGGPCPPPGKPHRYFFKLYALDAALELKPGATKKDVERAMEKRHVLAQGQLMGTYQRRR